LAADDVNRQRIKRSRDLHNLKPVRPLVWIDEIPWHEMDIKGELILHCESEQARQIEQHFRRVLYRWKYIQADMVVEDTFYVEKSFTDSGIGISVNEKTIATDTANYIVSHKYEDQLDSEDKIEAIKMPIIQANPDLDEKALENANNILDGILPVKLRGHEVYFAPWDYIARFRGVENCLVDMIENPQLIHKTIAKFTKAYLTKYTQMEEQGLLDYNQPSLHCTPPYADGIPASDHDGGKVRFKDMWFRGMAQLFSCASPAMQDEFDLQYMRGIMDKFALSYYGCCEPLDKFIPYLKKIPNMRKIGISAWADVRSSAEQIGSDYVFAYKPNPAYVAGEFNKNAVEKEIIFVLEECVKNKCPLEFVLKDISTVNYNPYNLINWTKTVLELVDRYYDFSIK
jgi:hypothetical protein